MTLFIESKTGNKGRREFSINWIEIVFVLQNGFYTSQITDYDEYYFYTLTVTIKKDLFDCHPFLEKDVLIVDAYKKSQLKIIRTINGEYQLTTKFKLSISKVEYKKMINSKEGYQLRFSARYKGPSNKDENYDDILKRMKKREENKKGYSKTPIKVVLGGAVNPR